MNLTGPVRLVGFPSGTVYGAVRELVSINDAGLAHFVATVTGVLMEVWGIPRALWSVDVQRARPWTPPPKRAPRAPKAPAAPPPGAPPPPDPTPAAPDSAVP